MEKYFAAIEMAFINCTNACQRLPAMQYALDALKKSIAKIHFLHATMSIQMSMTLANKLHVRQKREIGMSKLNINWCEFTDMLYIRHSVNKNFHCARRASIVQCASFQLWFGCNWQMHNGRTLNGTLFSVQIHFFFVSAPNGGKEERCEEAGRDVKWLRLTWAFCICILFLYHSIRILFHPLNWREQFLFDSKWD